MEFRSERAALTMISETIVKAGVSLFNAIKYIYAISEEDFYNINVKDIIKVALNNITDTNILQNTGIRISGSKCKEMNNPDYEKILSLIVYSFAVRIPTYKSFGYNNDSLNDIQLKAIYEIVTSKGAVNHNDAIAEDFEELRRLVKSNKPISPYNAEWFKAYIYTNIPALSTINNRNMFLLGSSDILFTLFYSCLEEEIKRLIKELC